jgi:hypothetical protein
MSFELTNPFEVSDQSASVSTLYNGTGGDHSWNHININGGLS